MRRTARLLAATALGVTAAAGLAAPAYGGGTPPAAGAAAAPPPAGILTVSPNSVAPGTHVTATTDACGERGTIDGDASAVGAGRFALAPSADEGNAIGQFQVPSSAQPGTYEIVAKCAEGGRQAVGDLVVALSAAHGQTYPRGSVKTGVGGALGPDPVQTAAGVAALAVAAAGGTWLLHRRARGDGM